ncbi:alpha/beta hydrolase [Nonomuraea sp. B1E8]|uniref:alpha/beta hydrolase n=1 Tax=unclassified Nonomuraea TaxID=2593643 RepID=UPI00325DAC7F
MPLDPQAAALLDSATRNHTPAGRMTVAGARAGIVKYLELQGEPEPVARVRDVAIPGPASALPARAHYPHGEPPYPCLVHFHGGGWVSGDPGIYDRASRRLANATGCAVITVGYRKAPENRFPAPLDDCHAAVSWIAGNAADLQIDANRIGVSGDSAGGNLAAATCLRARDAGGPALRLQILIYPATDAACATASHETYARGYGLESRTMRWNWAQYLGTHDPADPYASPLRARLDGLPPALVTTAEFDPLRDEGELYAARLAAAGTPVTLTRYDGMIHAFYLAGRAFRRTDALYAQIGDVTREHLLQ